MGLLDKLFGKTNQPAADNTLAIPAYETPCKTEEELLERYAGIALEKQLDFGDVVGDMNWNADLQAGTIRFGTALLFPCRCSVLFRTRPKHGCGPGPISNWGWPIA